MHDDAHLWLREVITPWDHYQHGATNVLAWTHTPFQEVCIVETPALGKKLFLDGIVQSSQADEFVYHEALVQPAMMAVGRPLRVLVLGGGEGATLREVLRWRSVERALMIDLDAEVVALCRTHLPEWHQGSFDDARAEVRHEDAVAFLLHTDERFDVVVSDMTDPVEDGPSTFCFTQEYFASIAQVLTEGGVVAVQAGPVAPAEIALHAKVVSTMATVFPHVISYPCNAGVYGRPLGFVVASASPILPRLDPSRTAPLLDELVTGPLRLIDADVAHGLLQMPPYVRQAIVDCDRIYTDAAPPATAGSAGWEA